MEYIVLNGINVLCSVLLSSLRIQYLYIIKANVSHNTRQCSTFISSCTSTLLNMVNSLCISPLNEVAKGAVKYQMLCRGRVYQTYCCSTPFIFGLDQHHHQGESSWQYLVSAHVISTSSLRFWNCL